MLPEYEPARGLGYHGDHTAKWETSILMHLRPGLVDIERLDEGTATEGIYGEDPRRSASSYLGARVVERIVAHLSCKVAEFLGP